MTPSNSPPGATKRRLSTFPPPQSAAAKNRFPSTNVQYVAADLLAPPESWRAKFDFIFESYTLQSLPPDLRAQAFLKIAEFLKPAGLLLVIARGRYPEEDAGHVPWRLTRAEFAAFSRVGPPRNVVRGLHRFRTTQASENFAQPTAARNSFSGMLSSNPSPLCNFAPWPASYTR